MGQKMPRWVQYLDYFKDAHSVKEMDAIKDKYTQQWEKQHKEALEWKNGGLQKYLEDNYGKIDQERQDRMKKGAAFREAEPRLAIEALQEAYDYLKEDMEKADKAAQDAENAKADLKRKQDEKAMRDKKQKDEEEMRAGSLMGSSPAEDSSQRMLTARSAGDKGSTMLVKGYQRRSLM